MGCQKENRCIENEPFDQRSSAYISVTTNYGKKYCMSYSELLKVTPYDFMNYQLGKDERIDIYCGVTKLDIHAIEKILNSMNNVVYEVKDFPDSNLIKDMTEKAIDSSGIFKVRDYEFNLRGNMIDAAIKEGYIISFDGYEGEYFWEKNSLN